METIQIIEKTLNILGWILLLTSITGTIYLYEDIQVLSNQQINNYSNQTSEILWEEGCQTRSELKNKLGLNTIELNEVLLSMNKSIRKYDCGIKHGISPIINSN
jgi:hypothetical protein